jgi:hypothetical protein
MFASEYLDQLSDPDYLIGQYQMVTLDTDEIRVFTELDYHTCCNYEYIYVHALVWDGLRMEVKHIRLLETFPINREDRNDPNHPDYASYHNPRLNNPDYNDDMPMSCNTYYSPTACLWDVCTIFPLDQYGSYDEGIKAIHNSKWGDGADIIDPILESYYYGMVKCWSENEQETEELTLKNADWLIH